MSDLPIRAEARNIADSASLSQDYTDWNRVMHAYADGRLVDLKALVACQVCGGTNFYCAKENRPIVGDPVSDPCPRPTECPNPHTVIEINDESRLYANASHDLYADTNKVVEWCFVNGLPWWACPVKDHELHRANDKQSPAGRVGCQIIMSLPLNWDVVDV